MGNNINELISESNRLNTNAGHLIDVIKEFAVDGAKNVSINYEDEAGNTVTKSMPNMQKMVSDFHNNLNSSLKNYMEKVVYVDQQNGDDSNAGLNINNPLRTISHAISQIPVGGKVVIELVGDYVINSNLSVEYRHVIIKTNKKLTVSAMLDSNEYANIPGIALQNSNLDIVLENMNANTNTPVQFVIENTTNKELSPNKKGWIYCKNGHNSVSFSIWNKKESNNIIYLKDGAYLFNTYAGNTSRYSKTLLSFGGYYRGYIRLNENSKIGVLSRIGLLDLLITLNNIILKNENNETLEWNNAIDGIVRDINGVPRNINSNKVL